MNVSRDIGEATSLAGLQKIYDKMVDSIVKSIRAKKPIMKETVSISIGTKYLDEDGMYIYDTSGANTSGANTSGANTSAVEVINRHRDFFKYLLTYTRDLYTDLDIDRASATVMLEAIEKKKDLRRQIERFQKAWFQEQVALSKMNGESVVIKHYPVCDASAELTTVQINVADALQMLERKSLLIEHRVVPGSHPLLDIGK